jgi:hypothetical protein
VPPAIPKIYPATFLSPGGALFGVAGFGDPTPDRRRVKFFHSDGIDHDTDDAGNSYWTIADGDWSNESGDSGGPLFTMNPDGTRHLVGVTRGSAPDGDQVFVDITRSGMNDWVRGRITEGNVPDFLQHTDAWLAQHGKDRDSWWGQLDYDVLPCDEELDPDCDGWFSHHDNCLSKANPDQADSDDDGMGDVCNGAVLPVEAIGPGIDDEAVPGLFDPTSGTDEIDDGIDDEAVPGLFDPTSGAEEIGAGIDDEAVPSDTDPTLDASDIGLYDGAVAVQPSPVPPPPPVSSPYGGYRPSFFLQTFR